MRELAERIVDAVGEALGVDTGTCHEAAFEAAVTAVWKLLIDWHHGEK